MADCFPPEADDLHRRWLPREIFADIGIVDTDAVPDATPDAVVGVEDLAAQLAGILVGGSKVCQLAPPPKPTPPPVLAAQRHGAQVCGLEGSVVAACGVTSATDVGAAAAAMAWPFVPYQPVQWQGGSNLVNLGGVLDYYSASAFPLAPVLPPANMRSGTGVFIPRTSCYLPPAKGGGIATRAWCGRPATGKKQEWQQSDGMKPLQGEKASGAALHACPRPELALLPQDWSYR